MARDYRAEYAARVARGAERGLRPSDAAGQQRRSSEQTRHVPRESRIEVDEGAVRVVQSADRSYVMRALRQAAADGDHVVIYTVWKTDTGYGTQVYGGRDRAHQATREGDRGEGKFKVLIADRDTLVSTTGTTGVPAQQIIDALSRDENGDREYDDLDQYLGDWWDDDEGEYGAAS